MLKLYDTPFPSSRSGALYNAFSYPTKISAEAEAIFIACHTSIGDTILDPFGGSGTTGIATKLVAAPTPRMMEIASKLQLNPTWGPRKAIIYEISVIGSMIGRVLCNTDPIKFQQAANDLLERVKKEASKLYSIQDNDGNTGMIRHIIWSDVIICPHCKREVTYADCCVSQHPLRISDVGHCPLCNNSFFMPTARHASIEEEDKVLKIKSIKRKRVPYKIYGITNNIKWSRLCTNEDIDGIVSSIKKIDLSLFPKKRINWGLLYRSGYHFGITHLHHFYTERNAYIMNLLWNEIKSFPESIQDALKVFVLSYNASHSTLMTRVVAKKNSQDFVLTGAQSGVLYISNLPVEKNIFLGLKRKIKTFVDALSLTYDSLSEVNYVNGSSLNVSMEDKSVDYIFTDPPFGDFIPYSEINQINELWLNKTTDNTEEVIINPFQQKNLERYDHLMAGVFQQVSRVLKDNGWCTVVFHSAKAEIWQVLYKVFEKNGLYPRKTSILDKLQASFKQTNSMVTVKGDPLILLSKNKKVKKNLYSSDEILEKVISSLPIINDIKSSVTKRYSEYVRLCLENGVAVKLNANSPQLYGQ